LLKDSPTVDSTFVIVLMGYMERTAWLQECQTTLAKTVIRGRLYDAQRCRLEYCQIDVDSSD